MDKTATSVSVMPTTTRAQREGFTIIELLVAMAIILILAGIIFGVQRGVYHAQSTARARADMAVMAIGLEQFKSLYGDYPWINSATPGGELYEVFVGERYIYREGTGEPEMGNDGDNRRPLLDIAALDAEDEIIMDPWGNQYMYFYRTGYADGTWENPSYLLMSKGPDADWASDANLISKGIISDDFFTTEKDGKAVNLDTIIYGYEN